MITEFPYKDREEWLALRKNYIGGSDAGSVIGLNPYKSAYSLWAEKTGRLPEWEGNLTTRVGGYLEELVAQLFTEETGKKVRKKNRMMVNDKYPWASANVDRLIVGEKALLEIKTTNSPVNIKKFKNDEFPEAWYCQMTHYLAVSGLKKAYLAVLIECKEFRIFELNRDEEEIKALMAAEETFWDCVQKDTPPEPDGLISTSEALSSLYPTDNGESVNLFNYNGELAQYLALTEQIKQLEETKSGIGNRIKLALGEASRGETDRYKAMWTASERKNFDRKRFEQDNPQIDLSSYYKITSVRSLRITEREVV